MKKTASPRLVPMAPRTRAAGQSRSPSPNRLSNIAPARQHFVQPTRRRLSLVNSDMRGYEADGMTDQVVNEDSKLNMRVGRGGIVTKYASKSKVGVVSANPYKVNQDSHVEIEALGSDPSQYWFCVMDGHGSEGHEVSDLVKRRLPLNIIQDRALRSDPRLALVRGFLRTNQELHRSGINVGYSGSTCIGVLIRGTTLYAANVGDSRAVLGRVHGLAAGQPSLEAVPLSSDHKPDRPDEMQRILKSQGRVEAFRTPEGDPIGPPRVWLRHQDAPGLAMSRSFGDSVAAQVGVVAEPEVTALQLTGRDKFIVIASDGVWEFMDSPEVVRMVAPFWERADPQAACEYLVAEAQRRWRQEEEVIDDTTCIVIFLSVPE